MPEACNFFKEETLAQVFELNSNSFEFYGIFKKTFFYRIALVAASKNASS